MSDLLTDYLSDRPKCPRCGMVVLIDARTGRAERTKVPGVPAGETVCDFAIGGCSRCGHAVVEENGRVRDLTPAEAARVDVKRWMARVEKAVGHKLFG